VSIAQLQLACRGVVQGVGFRPAAFRLARGLALTGTIANRAGWVQLELHGPRSALEDFVALLPGALPPQARLEQLEVEWMQPPQVPAAQLSIAADAARPLGSGWMAPALAADRAPCRRCLAELRDPGNRRCGYPFISCCDCGPRYSIATAEPYARQHTTLAPFPLCAACQSEFADPQDHRFHAETIGCGRCGPRLQLRAWTAAGAGLDGAPGAVIAAAVTVLRRGGVLALQGVGGFQLLVDATNPAAVARVRRAKRRPRKPLALLVADPAWLRPWVRLSHAELQLLQGPEAPIVLLRRHPPSRTAAASLPPLAPAVAPHSSELGVMLPASPLHQLLSEAFGGPLVATSANPSGEPLCISLEQVLQQLGQSIDAWLVHNRPIARPLDDSVVRWLGGRLQTLRRARGYAPLPLPGAGGQTGTTLLALGGDLKSAPAVAWAGRIWLAPQQGDLAVGRCHDRWQQGAAELVNRCGPELQAIVSDLHPGYLSQQWARQQARSGGMAHRTVQHHQAHGLAVLAEHGLMPPALALACDGLGHGPVAAAAAVSLWGGEALLLEPAGACRRLASLRPLALPGGELALREPRRVALGLLAALGETGLNHAGAAATRAAFAAAERELLLQALAAHCQSPDCSSLGRLFDAVASLLDLVQRLSYEGEAGLLLQGAAEQLPAERHGAYALPLVKAPAGADVAQWFDWQPLVLALLDDRAAGAAAALCSWRFHRALIRGFTAWARAAAARTGVRRVVLAGGCFQNRLLLEGLIVALRRQGLQPLWAQRVPSGDGGLALGQLLALQSAQP
jgi:hydrogenase maturation protein HypF